MGGNGKWTQIEQGQYYFICGAAAWAPRFTSAAVSPPAASDTPPHRPEHGGGSGGAALYSNFTVFLFSPELVSLLESSEPSEAGDLCFNFGSQLSGSLLLLADLLLFRSFFFLNGYSFPALASLTAIWFSFGHSNICPRDLENELPLAA